MAANQINSVARGASNIPLGPDHEESFVLGDDCACAAGMPDEQLAASLKVAVDGVIGAQDAMVASSDSMESTR